MAAGIADDLATTLLLATDKPVLAAPAMNVRMWQHAATVRNVAQLRADGVTVMEPDEGAMACGEYGPGRLPEPRRSSPRSRRALAPRRSRSPAGTSSSPPGRPTSRSTRSATSPTAPRAAGLRDRRRARRLGARVTLVAGPVTLPTPAGVDRVDVETAREMAAAVDAALPADAAVMVAAVADWRVETLPQKLKKGDAPPALTLVENPDILAALAHRPQRPRLLIGFAAETENVVEHAIAKRLRKGCRLDRRQRRVGRRDGRRRTTASTSSPPTASKAGRACPKTRSRRGWPTGSPMPDRNTGPDLSLKPQTLPVGDMTTAIRSRSSACRTASGLPLPAYATAGAAGMDVVAAEALTLAPGARHAVATGFAIAIPDGLRGAGPPALRPRAQARHHLPQHARHDRRATIAAR